MITPSWTIWAVRMITAVLLVFNLVVLGLYMVILHRIKIFHLNLRLLLFNVAFASFGLVLGRCSIFFALYYYKVPYEQNLANDWRTAPAVASYALTLSVVAFAIERSFAMSRSSTYEFQCNRFPLLGLTLLFIVWPTSFIMIISQQKGLLDQYVLSGFLTALYCFSFLAIFILKHKSRLIYERQRIRQFEQSNCHSLSQRYQLSENVRSVQLLNPTIGFLTGTSLILSGFFIFVTKFLVDEWLYFCYEGYYMLKVLQAITALILVLNGHHAFRLELHRLIWRRKTDRAIGPLRKSTAIRAINGRWQLIIEATGEEYFNALRKAWQ